MGSFENISNMAQSQSWVVGNLKIVTTKVTDFHKCQSHEGSDHFSFVKNTKPIRVFVILNYFGHSSLLSFIFAIILAYRNNNCNGRLLAYGCAGQWVKYQLFFGKHYLKVAKMFM